MAGNMPCEASRQPGVRVVAMLSGQAGVICSPERYKVGENIFFLLPLLHLVAIIAHFYCQDQNLVVPFCK